MAEAVFKCKQRIDPPFLTPPCSFDGPLTYGGGSNARDYEAARISTTIETVRDAQDLVFTEWCNP
jgi:hypothetical protein